MTRLIAFVLAFCFSLAVAGSTFAQQETDRKGNSDEERIDHKKLTQLIERVKKLPKNEIKFSTPLPEEALKVFDIYGQESIEPLAKLLIHKNSEVRRRAAEGLEFSYDVEHVKLAASKALAPAFFDDDWRVRQQAFDSYRPMGELVPIHLEICVASLEDPHPDVAQAALSCLSYMGDHAFPALDRILLRLQQKDGSQQWELIKAVGRFGPKAHKAIPVLKNLVGQDTDDYAAMALGRIGARDVLVKMIDDKHVGRRDIIRGLGELPETDDDVIKRLVEVAVEDSDKYMRSSAIFALGQVRPATETVSKTLSNLLGDEEEMIARGAAEGLQSTDPKFPSAVPALINATKSEHEYVRDFAAAALKLYDFDIATQTRVLVDKIINDDRIHFGTEFEKGEKEASFESLMDLARDKTQPENVRATAAFALSMAIQKDYEMSRFEKTLREFMTELIKGDGIPASLECTAVIALKNLDCDVEDFESIVTKGVTGAAASYLKMEAIEAVQYEGLAEAIPAVIEAVDDKHPYVASAACRCLSSFGEMASDAVPHLCSVAEKRTEVQVRSDAMNAITEIATNLDSVVPMLIKLLSSDDMDRQRKAANAVAELCGKTSIDRRPFVAPLSRLAKSENSAVRSDAMEAIGALGKAGTPAAKIIFAGMRDQEAYVRSAAAFAVGGIGRKNKWTIGRLTELLDDESNFVRIEAMKSLAKFHSRSERVLVLVKEMIESDDNASEVFPIIAFYGDSANPFFPLLKTLVERQNDRWSQEILITLAEIGPAAKEFLPLIRTMMNKDDEDALGYMRTLQYRAALAMAPKNREVAAEVVGRLDLEYSNQEAIDLFDEMPTHQVKTILSLASNGESKKAKRNAKKLLEELEFNDE